MRAAVEWVASALFAAWERQESEGRYRGADEFRALHIDPGDALASWRAATLPDTAWPDELVAWFEEWTGAWDEADRLSLDGADRLVSALALAVELEPRLRPLVAALTDDPTVRAPSVGLACELAGAVGLLPADVRRACAVDGRLAWFDIVRALPVSGRPSVLDAQLVASSWLVDTMADAPVEETVRWVAAPTHGDVTSGSDVARLALRGADHLLHAERAAAAYGATRAALAVAPPDAEALGRLARTALLADAPLVVACDSQPEPWLVEGCDRCSALGAAVAVSTDRATRWVPPPTWRPVAVEPLAGAERKVRWRAALDARGVAAKAADVEAVAVEFALGADAVDDAATRVRVATPDNASADLAVLRAAARNTVWRDLTTVARPGPSGVGWDDLVVAPQVATPAARDRRRDRQPRPGARFLGIRRPARAAGATTCCSPGRRGRARPSVRRWSPAPWVSSCGWSTWRASSTSTSARPRSSSTRCCARPSRPARCCCSTRRTRCSAGAATSRRRATAGPTSRWPICCSASRTTMASPCSPPT